MSLILKLSIILEKDLLKGECWSSSRDSTPGCLVFMQFSVHSGGIW